MPLWGAPGERAEYYQVLYISGGNQSSKTYSSTSEFCADVRGERPWDGTLTHLDREPGDWLYAGPSFTKHFPTTLSPYFETRMGDLISWRKTDNNKNTVEYHLVTGDVVHCLSYEQHLRAGQSQTDPFEGARWKGALFDEPPPRQVYIATLRGLMRWSSRGAGRMYIGATAVKDPFLINDVYYKAWNKGGPSKRIFAIEFSTADNPSLTERDRAVMAETMTEEEKEMRLHGRPPRLVGRIYKVFDENVHVFDENRWDPLLTRKTQHHDIHERVPSDWPVICLCDPHDTRPWVFIWVAVSPQDDYYVVREWPQEPYANMRRWDNDFDSYAQLIEDIESELPGGQERVTQRIMDPNFGRTQKAGSFQSVQEEMMVRGYYFDVDVQKSLALRHTKVRTQLNYDKSKSLSEMNRPKLFVGLNECRNTIWAFMNYIHKQDKDPTKAPPEGVEDAGKDHMDCIGWMCVKGIRYHTWKTDPAREREIAAEADAWADNALG